MRYTYRLHEVFPDGSLYDTGHIIEVSSSYCVSDTVSLIFNVYGFNNYNTYYRSSDYIGDTRINITYNYIVDGAKHTWVLIKEEIETKEE
jgi:hypothetical protein